jgi:hypothetical protein
MKTVINVLNEYRKVIPRCIVALVLFTFIVGCNKADDPTTPEDTFSLDGTWQSRKISDSQIFRSLLVNMVADNNRVYGNGVYVDELPFEISTGVYKSTDVSFSFYLENTNLGKVYCQFMGNIESDNSITGRLVISSSYGNENYILNLTKQSVKYVAKTSY